MKLSPTHPAFAAYAAQLAQFATHGATNEGATRFAFQTLLSATLPPRWAVLGEQTLPGNIRPDGVVKDEYKITRGFWEAKDTHDDLDEEIRKKTRRGYPLTNTIFEDTRRAVLYQNRQPVLDVPTNDPAQLARLLAAFYGYEAADTVAFGKAVAAFQADIPDIAKGLQEIITGERERNLKFNAAFDGFRTLCRASIDPGITDAALDEMLIQHLLTERLFRTVFDNPQFTQRNAIAAEIERVIDALAGRFFNRADFLRRLDGFYRPVEDAARGIHDWADKQAFLNTVYERFFQGYSVRQADTHGIVYTPQEIVEFMCRSVVHVLKTEFGKELGDPDVVILDPATGTGNFIVNLIRHHIPAGALQEKYRTGLFANEIMLLPYYIASQNIEHAYYERAESYEPFPGLCFADTLDMSADAKNIGLFSEANTQRILNEANAKVNVIIGNPPYNTKRG